mmetsp:Transcript_8060/g.14315  ORF Transcript_8060/g.14315 Transcript_8060/m.14315 type:complete len:408 (+) Transcript_8060:144-1367(+)|eukprot:CAMPEP_0184707430 /NCGR_PEP_ID=MMETSP0313-20130426/37267_1 /TAXON_ID=2792 /ORGANISM="Porphyridium aerugineum, Strain SAG 1380-2" /LENGTH=407 /DNA_ID=CAMNT_0027169005 /DNA_START=140 /DNA_END=1363 /DNA_ORIENTATION=+
MADFLQLMSSNKPKPKARGEVRLEIAFSAHNLKNMDFFSKSDPFIIVYAHHGSTINHDTDVSMIPREGGFIPISMTETVWDNLSPQFVTKFRFPYATKEHKEKRIRIKLLDRDSEQNNSIEKNDFLGMAEFRLCDVIGDRDIETEVSLNSSMSMELTSTILSPASSSDHPFFIELPLCDDKCKPVAKGKLGSIRIYGELVQMFPELPQHMLSIDFGFKAVCNLPARRGLFYVISRSSKNGQYFVPVHRSGVLLRSSSVNMSAASVNNSDNDHGITKAFSGSSRNVSRQASSSAPLPQSTSMDIAFQTVELSDTDLFVNDWERIIRFELYEHNKRGAHELLFSMELPAKDMRHLQAGDEFTIVMPTKKKELVHAKAMVMTGLWNSTQTSGILAIRCYDFAWAKVGISL